MMSSEEAVSNDGKATTLSAGDLGAATTMIAEDGTQYIIVMDESGEGAGDDAAIAVSEEATILPEEGLALEDKESNEKNDDNETVYVVDDGDGNYRLVDPATAAAAREVAAGDEGADAEGTTIVIDPSSLADTSDGATGGVQFLVDEEGNLLVDEEGNPFRMTVEGDHAEGTTVEAKEEEEEAKYVIIEDEHGQQMVVDAASLMGAENLTTIALDDSRDTYMSVDKKSRTGEKLGSKQLQQQQQPKDVVTKKAVGLSGGPLSVSNSMSVAVPDTVPAKRRIPDESEPDWSKIDPKKLKFVLKYGCGFCGAKSYRDINDLKKHRRGCEDRDRYACETCAPHATYENCTDASAAMIATTPAGGDRSSKKARTASVNSHSAASPSPSRMSSPIYSTAAYLADKIGGKAVHGSTSNSPLGGGRGRPSSLKPGTKSTPPAVDLKCRVCGKVYVNAEQLKLHLIGVHLGSTAFAPQVVTTVGGVPAGTTIVTDAGTILQPGGETVQLIASGPPAGLPVVGQWVA